MRPNADPASYEGMPLQGLRNLSPLHFAPDPDVLHVFEDESARRPIPAPLPSTVRLTYRPEPLPVNYQVRYPEISRPQELGNETLPIFSYREEIALAVKDNPVTIITAETGAGKSTQVPQMLHDAGWDRVYLTQPRRAAARNVFERIREEIAAVRGNSEAQNAVSYQTAGERDGPEDAPIKVVTDGLHLVRELHDSGLAQNEVLIIDEVHEWNSNIEVLTSWVRRVIADKPHMRVVIMSATLDADRLANYFSDVCPKTPPIIEVPGRNFSVINHEKPESTVAEEVLKAAETLYREQKSDNEAPNGILVFEPGKREIGDLIDELRRRLPPHISKAAVILPLHAKLSPAEQQATFRKYPGVKIVVATEVAQTSLTIPDIAYVIDSGFQRRIELDNEGIQGLVLHPTSQADCDQRAGRAGRVSDGHYILTRLDATTPHTSYISREKYPMAEILRTDIVRNTLRIAAVGLNISELDLYHPVAPHIIEQAQATLRALGALDETNSITTMGKRMNAFPVRASSARMMVEADGYSDNTRSYMAAIVAAKEAGGLPYFAYDVGKRWQALSEETASDLLTQLDIFTAIQGMPERLMADYDLDLNNVERAREQYAKIARLSNAYQAELLPPSQQERADVSRCITAGLITSAYKRTDIGTYIHIGHTDTPRTISNRSIVRDAPSVVVGEGYRVEYTRNGERVVKHLIEGVTATTLQELGRIAAGSTVWNFVNYSMRAGKFHEVRRQTFLGEDTGVVQEIPARPSPQLRAAVIEHALAHPGNQQRLLRKIKSELTTLARLAKDPVPQLSQDLLLELIREAAVATITDPSELDNNLRAIVETRGISLSSFVTPERHARILADAPPEVTVNDRRFRIAYNNSRPVIRSFKRSDIADLTDELYLRDTRHICFVYERREYTLAQLQEKLGLKVYARL